MKETNGIKTMHDLAITLKQDRPGEFAKAVTAIANARVNIEGFAEIEGRFHCVTSDPQSARKALDGAGFSAKDTEVFVFGAEDRPGYLADVLSKVAAEEVNVITAYTLTNTRIALAVDQPSRVREVLEELTPATTRSR